MNNSRLFSFLSLALLLSCAGSTVMCMEEDQALFPPTPNIFSRETRRTFNTYNQADPRNVALLLFAVSHLTEGVIEKHLDKNNSARKITEMICHTAKDSGAINAALYFSGNNKRMGNIMPILHNIALQCAGDKIDLVKSLSKKTRYNELPDWSKRIIRAGAAHGLWLLEVAIFNYFR